jgi:signal transduction histidine kinase
MFAPGSGGGADLLARVKGENGQAALITYAFWLTVWLAYAVFELIAGLGSFLSAPVADCLKILLFGTAALAILPAVRWTERRGVLLRLPAILCAVVLVTLAQATIGYSIDFARGGSPIVPIERIGEIQARLLLYRFYLVAADAAIITMFYEGRRRLEDRVALVRAEAEADRARLAALRFQLNPHFLFNSLNAISSLVVTRRPAEAEEMLLRLADFLRMSLAAEPERMVALDDELAAVETYLGIEAIRFGERLGVVIDCPPEIGDARVPGFLLQPLVENAVKYGVAPTRRRVTIAVTGRAEGDTLHLAVADDGGEPGGDAEPGFGIGTANVRARLQALFGTAAGLDCGRQADGRWVATVRLPLVRAELDRAGEQGKAMAGAAQ